MILLKHQVALGYFGWRKTWANFHFLPAGVWVCNQRTALSLWSGRLSSSIFHTRICPVAFVQIPPSIQDAPIPSRAICATCQPGGVQSAGEFVVAWENNTLGVSSTNATGNVNRFMAIRLNVGVYLKSQTVRAETVSSRQNFHQLPFHNP